MRFITSFSLVRSNLNPNPLWGDDVGRGIRRNLRQLVVLVSTRNDTTDSVLAYGIDPDRVDPSTDVPVFAKVVPTQNLGAFLKIVVDGDEPSPESLYGPLADSVDIPTPQPPRTGPRLTVVFAYASALRTDEIFAQLDEEADTTPPPPPSQFEAPAP